MMKTYIEIREWLESFIPLVYGKEELGLERIENLLSKLGNPQKSFKSILVGGTSGKGSTAFYISRLLKEKGLKVGLHVSPHLIYIGERMQILQGYRGQGIGDSLRDNTIPVKRLVSLVNEIKPVIEAIGVSQSELLPSYFEILVAISFLYFEKEKVDWAVVEVGLGGRLDATNILSPEICVITNVGLDHTELLGETVEKIAKEKAGIIKKGLGFRVQGTGRSARVRELKSDSGVPVVTGARRKGLKVIEKVAKSKNTPLINIYTQGIKNLQKVDVFRYITKPNDIYRYVPYYVNAECALLALTTVLELFKRDRESERQRDKSGRILTKESVKKAFSVGFAGRFEEIDERVIVDGAHNADKMKALVHFVRNSKLQNPNPKIQNSTSIILVLAFKKGKNWQEMIDMLMKNLPIKKIIATQYFATTDMGPAPSQRLSGVNKGSAVEPEEIRDFVKSRLCQGYGGQAKWKIKVESVENSQEAVFSALSSNKLTPKQLILVTGSLYLVGEARTLWKLPEF